MYQVFDGGFHEEKREDVIKIKRDHRDEHCAKQDRVFLEFT